MSLADNLRSVKANSHIMEIFGLGYVGLPLAIRLASAGMNVTGIDIDAQKIARLKAGRLIDLEVEFEDEFNETLQKEYLKLQDRPERVQKPKIGVICVPTPIPTEDTRSDIHVVSATRSFMDSAKDGDMLILESSIELGTTEKIQEIIEGCGHKVGENFGLCFCPERIDPTNRMWRMENIPRVIYCSDDTSFEISKSVYQHVNGGDLKRVSSPMVAEMVKSLENSFRLVNISLVNELAILCDQLGINAREVINAAATKPFGFKAHYPGAGAGGHCIPKDPKFLLESAKKTKVGFNSIKYALEVNQAMPAYVVNVIDDVMRARDLDRTVLVCGLSYKANIGDMRDSPGFKIVDELRRRDIKVFGYDRFFDSSLMNKYLVENHITRLDCKIIDSLEKDVLGQTGCLCIVQHHDDDKDEIARIYREGAVPFIYDCQNRIKTEPDTDTVLEFLGG